MGAANEGQTGLEASALWPRVQQWATELGFSQIGVADIDLGSDSIWGVVHSVTDPLRGSGGTFRAYRKDLIANAIADANLKLTELEAVQ